MKKLVISLALALLSVSALQAGITGKISGKIVDSQDGSPLPAVNVILDGSSLGAATDAEGDFSLLNLPAGTYTLIVRMMGYQEMRFQGVRVNADLTTWIDVKLNKTVLQSAEEIIVQVKPDLLRFDVTSKMSLVEARDLQDLPVVSVQELLKTQAGFTEDASGEIHVRGGRGKEILYIVDGMPLKDPMTGQPATLINPQSVQEMEVLSGTYNAEYGDAMSAVVNVITQNPTEKFNARLEFLSPFLNSSPYRSADWGGSGTDVMRDSSGTSLYNAPTVENLIDPSIPVLGIVSGSLTGPIPLDKRLGFAISSRYRKEDSYLPFGYDVEHQGLGKLRFQATPRLKLTATGDLSRRQYQGYSHDWRYLHEGYRSHDRQSGYFGVQANHTLLDNLFYAANLYYLRQHQKTGVGNKTPDQYIQGQRTGEAFYFANDDDIYQLTDSWTYGGKADFNYQGFKAHAFKFGFDLKQHRLADTTYVQPWPGGANDSTKYNRWADEYSAYVQDKIELRYLVVNLGLRLDYINPRSLFWSDPKDPNTPMTEVDPHYQLSPRLGLAHPVTATTMLHFAYGHFFQKPSFREVYYNSQYWTNPEMMLEVDYPLVGNPRVKPQKTVAYEAGVKQALGPDLALDVNLWYKDVTDLLATTEVRAYPYHFVVYDNADYASVRGFDLSLHKRFEDNFSASLNYSFSVATGNRSDPTAGYWDAYAQENPPNRETFLDFDRRHDVAFDLNYEFGAGDGPRVGEYPILERTGFNLLLTASSGMPYTPYVGPTVDVDENSARMGWTATVDMELRRALKITPLSATLILQVNNLFDAQNPMRVWSRTGKPWDDGWEGLFSSYDMQRDPSNVGPPRLIRAGIRLEY
jgi:outer membrane receptor protein involved in Fe transport